MSVFAGIEVIISPHVPQFKDVDRGWWRTLLRFYRVPLMLTVNKKLVMHPATYERYKRLTS